MPPTRTTRAAGAAGTLLLMAAVPLAPTGSEASSHRDAPLIAEDPVADNTDLYAFVAPDATDHVTLIANFIPMEEPAGGPNFHNFGDDVLYEIKIDNDGDAVVETTYQFKFTTTINDGTTPLYNEGKITWGSGEYDNLNVEQKYTVTEILNNGTPADIATNVPVAPANIGPRSTPEYDSLAAHAITPISTSDGTIKVFAGPRDESFPVDLGSIFDLGALRPLNNVHLSPMEKENGVNATTGFNVHTIAIQVPKARIVGSDPVIGVHSTASRRETTTRATGTADPTLGGGWAQVSRLGNPLVNEVVVPLSSKDTFNATAMSSGDSAFQPIVEDPRLGQLLPVLYPGAFGECYPTAPRNDLVTIFLKGIPGLNQPSSVTASEQLRLNTSTAPTAWEQQLPLGLLAGQNDGFPNGRRPIDDVVDIELQAVAGATAVGDCNGKSPNNQLGDGVSGNDKPFLTSFPYLPSPHEGYEHTHDHGSEDDPTSDSRRDQIRRLYLAYFLREADAAGFDYWFESGLHLQTISQLFAESTEFTNKYGSLNNEDFVERVYNNVMKRSSDSAGKTYWVGLLNGGTTRGQVMLAFSNSAEFKAKVS